MNKLLLSLLMSFFIFSCTAFAQSGDFATITVKAGSRPVSITINGELFEKLNPNKSLSFGIAAGLKKHIVLEDNDGNKFVKDITAQAGDQGRNFVVQFPGVNDEPPAKVVTPAVSTGSQAVITSTAVVKQTGNTSVKTTAVEATPDAPSTTQGLTQIKSLLQQSTADLTQLIENIRVGTIDKSDNATIRAYNQALEALASARSYLLNNKSQASGASNKLVTAADTAGLRKSVVSLQSIIEGRRPSSKNLLIAFAKNRPYDLQFLVSKKNIADTLIDDKSLLMYALEKKCNAATIKELINIAGGKETFINIDKYSFSPPHQSIYMMPLTLACINGDAEVVNVLIDAKARFYPASLDEYKAKYQSKFLWQQFGANREIRSLIVKRMPDFPDPYRVIEETVSELYKNMVLVEGGAYKMGCIGDRADCGRSWPQVDVSVSPFYMCKFEVTQKQWEAIMEYNPSTNAGCATCPVEKVSWEDVQIFFDKLNKLTGKRFRLPSEKEWEFAATGGRADQFKYAGSNNLDSVAWCSSNTVSTRPVGSKAPNSLGLFDMSGNVFEWCSSYHTDNLEPYKISPEGATIGIERVTRGGSFRMEEFFAQPVRRSKAVQKASSYDIGFRVAMDK